MLPGKWARYGLALATSMWLSATPLVTAQPTSLALQAARDAYVLMRAARHGLNWRREARKFPDPILDLVFKRVEDAWNLSRTPVDRTGYGPVDYAQMSIRDMTQAIRLLDQALTLLQ